MPPLKFEASGRGARSRSLEPSGLSARAPLTHFYFLLLRRRRRDVVTLFPLSPLTLTRGARELDPVRETAVRLLLDDHLVGVVAPDVETLVTWMAWWRRSGSRARSSLRGGRSRCRRCRTSRCPGEQRIAPSVPDEHTLGLGTARDDAFDVCGSSQRRHCCHEAHQPRAVKYQNVGQESLVGIHESLLSSKARADPGRPPT